MNITYTAERLTKEEYISFLKRTDLGSQYPKERFEERIERLLKNAPISVSARNEDGLLVGVILGITDFAYWLFITDLGVDRDYVKKGIGNALMKKALTLAGGEEEIIVYTCANENAVGFYEKFGMEHASDVMVFSRVHWTPFTV
ncbi:MAG: GNAT family N-acetyltransferase [Clostridiales bacterium]|nr:GNAT family N-acetyltransferase [Clostridiales bacterium]